MPNTKHAPVSCYSCRRYSADKACPLQCIVTDGRCWEPKNPLEAAAPDLLEVLKDLCECLDIELRNENTTIQPVTVEHYNKAIKVIAKAEKNNS